MRNLSKSMLWALSATALSTPALAQEVATESPSASDIVVTGSRIVSTFQAPTPVTTLSNDQIKARAAVNLVDLLQDIPTVRPGNNNTSSTNIGTAAFDMRSLGSIRTLTMIDGRRAMDSNAGVSPLFDVNLIPGGLIKSIDIVTAGASSVYGSDAISGVVNILMDSNLVGFKADGQFTSTQRGDALTGAVDLAWGKEFAGGRGHVVLAASVYDRPDILYQRARDWGRDGTVLLTNPNYTTTNGQYRQLILPGATLSRVTNGGLILNATTTTGTAANSWAFRNVQFGAGGAQSPFVLGNYVGGVWMQGGGGLFTSPDYAILVNANKRASGFGRVTYDVSDKVQVFAELLYARTKGHYTNTINYDSGTIIIKRDNAFLPANILASMITNNIASFTMGRTNAELGQYVHVRSDNEYIRPVVGAKGDLGGTWHWDASAVFTQAKYSATVSNNRDEAKWNLAKDSVIGPNGQPICRSTLTDPSNGCVPVNLFGENAISQAVASYVGGTSHNDTTAKGVDAAVNVGGDLFNTWAGPVGVSVGAEYRTESVNLKTDPVAAVNGWRQAASAPYSGKYNVKEFYGEANIPLLSDSPIAKQLELSLAGRAVDYSTSGWAKVYKIGGNWTVNDQLRFRATYSRDFRAPKLAELFAANFESQGATVVDRSNNATVPIRTITGGNPNLKPEIGKTLTFGVVLQPDFIPGLRLSADYFDIKLDNAISVVTGQDVVDRCAGGDQNFCAGITRDAVGAIFRVKTVSYNASYLKTNGWDIAASYRLPLGNGGTLNFGANFTYTAHLTTLANATLGLASAIDRAGQVTAPGVPHWRGTFRTTYTDGPLNLSLLANYIGNGRYDTTYGPLDLNRNSYPAYVYLSLNAGYQVSQALNLYVKVDNLTDTDPPLLAGNTIIRAQAAGTAGYYDQLGRSFTIGARLKY